MPPKPRFTREEVLAAALEIIREDGEDALTARALGARLGSSTRPLFTLFASMDDLRRQVYEGPARQAFQQWCRGFDDYTPAFKRIGMSIVSFAEAEPRLFSFLFVSPHGERRTLDEWAANEVYDSSIAVIERDYGLAREDARLLFREMWLHAFAICVLKVTGAADISTQEISDSLTRGFMGLMALARAGRLGMRGAMPERGNLVEGRSVGNLPLEGTVTEPEETEA